MNALCSWGRVAVAISATARAPVLSCFDCGPFRGRHGEQGEVWLYFAGLL